MAFSDGTDSMEGIGGILGGGPVRAPQQHKKPVGLLKARKAVGMNDQDHHPGVPGRMSTGELRSYEGKPYSGTPAKRPR